MVGPLPQKGKTCAVFVLLPSELKTHIIPFLEAFQSSSDCRQHAPKVADINDGATEILKDKEGRRWR
jgi:hypothetical protein